MSNAHKGRRAEHRVRALLEAAGYDVVRSAASKGAVDLVAWNAISIRLVQVKTGRADRCYLSGVERETLRLLRRPPNATVECWRLVDGDRTPRIEVLTS